MIFNTINSKKILDHSANPHAYIDQNLRYRSINLSFCTWFSQSSNDIIGKKVDQFLGNAAFEKMGPLIKKAFLGSRVDFEGIINYPVRGSTYVRIALIPHFNRRKNKVTGVVVTIEDFSKLEKSFQRLSLLDKAKNEFLKIISHELNTPLNGIIGYSSILKENLPKDQYQEMIDFVIDSAERLHKLTEKALLITELTGKTYRLKAQQSDLVVLVNHCIEIKSSLIDQNFKIENALPDRIIPLCFEPQLIRKVVEHLIDNAKHHAGNDVTLKISVEEDSDYITLLFNDNGDGFSDEYLAYLFDFFASFDSTRIADKRYGLGLASVKLIMEAHDGRIQVTNNDEGGACVKLSFYKDICPATQ